MTEPESSWSVRSLLNPVVARLLIYGVDPFDLERVLKQVDATRFLNASQLETTWHDAWEDLANRWQRRSHDAGTAGHRLSAHQLGLKASTCRLAQFLTNLANVEQKRKIYAAYAEAYQRAVDWMPIPVVAVKVAMGDGSNLHAHLHVPGGTGPYPCAIVFAGLGSCKEEMHTLARLLVDRGIAALVPDMPGSGASLFDSGLVCSSSHLSMAFLALVGFVEQNSVLDANRLGAIGLCMGGGYAYRACHEQSRYRACVALFPLFVDATSSVHVPRWMRTGEWRNFQTGPKTQEEIFRELGWKSDYRLDCPLMLVHSEHDNWVTLERVRELFDNAANADRELVLVTEAPVYASGQSVTHTMPVGEQLGWVGPMVTDWLTQRLSR